MATASAILAAYPGSGAERYRPAAFIVNASLLPADLAAASVATRFLISGFGFDGDTQRERHGAATAAALAVVFYPGVEGDENSVLSLAGEGGAGAFVGLAGDGVLTAGRAFVWNVPPAEIAAVFSSGELVIRGPEIHAIICGGVLSDGVDAADVGLYIAGQFGPGGGAGTTLNFAGTVIDRLTDAASSSLTGYAALCAPQACLASGEADAAAVASYQYEFSHLTPQYASAADGGFRVAPLASRDGPDVDDIIVGPGAAAEDFAEAAALLHGRSVHSDVRLWLAPASRRAYLDAIDNGALRKLVALGGVAVAPGGVAWPAVLRGRRVATTSPRLFEYLSRGRSDVYALAVPGAAAAATCGHLTDPRPLC